MIIYKISIHIMKEKWWLKINKAYKSWQYVGSFQTGENLRGNNLSDKRWIPLSHNCVPWDQYKFVNYNFTNILISFLKLHCLQITNTSYLYYFFFDWSWNYWFILHFKLSPWFEYCICSFGYFPGVNLTPGKYPKEHIQYQFIICCDDEMVYLFHDINILSW